MARRRSSSGATAERAKSRVTDVKKALLAVRRLVERGNKVVLAAGDGESYIHSDWSKTKVQVKKKSGRHD